MSPRAPAAAAHSSPLSALKAMEVVKALTCVVNAAVPPALRELHAEVLDLRRENQRLRDELLAAHSHINLLRENITQDRDELERAQAEAMTAWAQARHMSMVVRHLSHLLQY